MSINQAAELAELREGVLEEYARLAPALESLAEQIERLQSACSHTATAELKLDRGLISPGNFSPVFRICLICGLEERDYRAYLLTAEPEMRLTSPQEFARLRLRFLQPNVVGRCNSCGLAAGICGNCPDSNDD